jgi:hypothetical protein
MANLNTPFGFRQAASVSGAAPNYAISERQIASTNTTAIYRGDPVVQLNTGYIAQATAGTTQIAGIFDGCTYTSISQGKKVWGPYWPGADAVAGSVRAFVIDSPEATFLVQSGNGGPVTLASVGTNINFGIGTGTTANGLSGAYADFATLGTTATLPFRIVMVGGQPSFPSIVGNGSDGTTAYNLLLVTFNNQDYRSTTGI